MRSMQRILFVCAHNAGRSVMAEAFFNHLADGEAEAVSAGTQPALAPHPEVVAVMREVGFDVAGHQGRLVTDEMVRRADRVVAMGCTVNDEACPAIRHRDVEDWGLADPRRQPLARVRDIRDVIERRVKELIAELTDPRS
jgi:arsenate reductase